MAVRRLRNPYLPTLTIEDAVAYLDHRGYHEAAASLMASSTSVAGFRETPNGSEITRVRSAGWGDPPLYAWTDLVMMWQKSLSEQVVDKSILSPKTYSFPGAGFNGEPVLCWWPATPVLFRTHLVSLYEAETKRRAWLESPKRDDSNFYRGWQGSPEYDAYNVSENLLSYKGYQATLDHSIRCETDADQAALWLHGLSEEAKGNDRDLLGYRLLLCVGRSLSSSDMRGYAPWHNSKRCIPFGRHDIARLARIEDVVDLAVRLYLEVFRWLRPVRLIDGALSPELMELGTKELPMSKEKAMEAWNIERKHGDTTLFAQLPSMRIQAFKPE